MLLPTQNTFKTTLNFELNVLLIYFTNLKIEKSEQLLKFMLSMSETADNR